LYLLHQLSSSARCGNTAGRGDLSQATICREPPCLGSLE
jgi:hypothetical protein